MLWDASGLINHYAQETGSDTVDAMFNGISSHSLSMIVTYLGYAENNASLRRNMNKGDIIFATYRIARAAVKSAVLTLPHFNILSITDADILSGMTMTDQHNVNSSDCRRYKIAESRRPRRPQDAQPGTAGSSRPSSIAGIALNRFKNQ